MRSGWKKMSIGFMLAGIVLVCAPAQAIKTFKSSGEVSAPAMENIIRIDERSYLLDTYVKVYDGQGSRIDLENLEVYTTISFEYSYTADGPRISSIQVLPR